MKRLVCLLITMILFAGMIGCSSKQNRTSKAYETSVGSSITTQLIASNENFELLWEDAAKAVQIRNLKSGKIWSNVPYEYYLSDGTSSKVNSTINITVSKTDNLAVEIARGYDAASNIESQIIENGIRVIYYFDAYEISVPVDYILEEDHVESTIDVNNISEGNSYMLLSVDIDPFLCSSKNNLKNSYLFVPVGSGALMYTNDTVDKARTFSGEVYGFDATAIAEEYINDEERIRLPVFGAKDENDALLCIINEGAGSAVISAEAGNSRTGYSNVYSTFYLRGYDTFAVDITTAQLGGSQYRILSDYIVDSSPKISYYPLANEESDYMGMANCYRNYLINKYELETKSNQTATFGLDIIGGTEITTTTLGVPHDKTVVLTNFQSALEIINDLNDTNIKPSVRMVGYGNSGIVPGKICGGYQFLSLYGKEKDRRIISDYSDKNNITLFYDFDLIRFSESGKGFTKTFDSAKTPSARVAQNSAVETPLRTNIGEKFNILEREKLNKAVSQLVRFAQKKNIINLSVDSFGEIAYSDYSKAEYEIKGNLDQQSGEIFNTLLQDNRQVATGSNLYAAVYASSVYDVPVDNGGYFSLSESIPFYQMVFRGLKPLYASSVNTIENPDKFIVDCLSSGTNLSFSVIDDYDIRYSENDQNYIGLGSADLYALKYKGNKENIKSLISKYQEIYSKLGNASIVKYDILGNGTSLTVFSNGLQLYANHTGLVTSTPLGELDAYSIKVINQ